MCLTIISASETVSKVGNIMSILLLRGEWAYMDFGPKCFSICKIFKPKETVTTKGAS